jgi:multiple sugar transport system permease protein
MEQLRAEHIQKTAFFRKKKVAIKLFGFSFLLIISVILMLPFFYLFASSLKNMGQFYSTDLIEVWFPWPLHFENYMHAVTKVDLFRYIINSVVLGCIQVIFCVFSSSFIAYGFARFEFPGRNVLFILVLATMMLPVQVTNIPLFIFYRGIKWTNTFLPLTIPHLFGSAWHIFLMRQFMITIPKELDEAAVIDGCNSWQIYRRIILPQCVPVLFVSALFHFLYSWKDLLMPLIYLSNSKLYTLPVGLLFFESPTDFNYTMQLAAVVIALIPTVLFYIVGKRYFERGINIAEFK